REINVEHDFPFDAPTMTTVPFWPNRVDDTQPHSRMAAGVCPECDGNSADLSADLADSRNYATSSELLFELENSDIRPRIPRGRSGLHWRPVCRHKLKRVALRKSLRGGNNYVRPPQRSCDVPSLTQPYRGDRCVCSDASFD